MARRILLADDSVTAQNMGRRILTDAGYEVVTVNNGSAALKKIAENKPDLIVLDVYMPGYGGLEVCQRVKESHETRQIPVLLTVGKLEPFKQEEARRVGADAFIIKPFEATELLTVLTRLEDKIVAQPQQKTGRFAKALAAVEQSDIGDRFGDRETGWKNRLTIPRPDAKPKAEEQTSEAIAVTPQHGTPESSASEANEAVKPVEPSRDFERPIPAGLPADITPEEIAAITAAAAAYSGTPEPAAASPAAVAADSVASPEVVSQEVVSSSSEIASSEIAGVQASALEAAATTLAAAPEVDQTHQEAPAEAQPVAAEVVPEVVASSEPARVEYLPATPELPAVEAAAEMTAAEAQASEAEKPTGNDAEVMAAIASLAPANGHAIESTQPAAQGSNGTGQGAAVHAAAVASLATGPRWIAEAVAVGADESKLALEQEMEQVHAARAVAQAARRAIAIAVESASSAALVEPAVPAIAAVAGVAESFAAATLESVPAPMAADSSVVESSVIQSSRVESSIAQSSIAEEAAFAAAASAGSTVEYPSPADAGSTTPAASELPESKSSAPLETEPPREGELAAAWRNWKQIRESLVESQPTSQVAEAPAVEATSQTQEEVATLAPSGPAQTAAAEAVAEVEAAASEVAEESTAIASIVDTMLAELRPKLVAEIAKKMSSEKKEKEKEKKKKR